MRAISIFFIVGLSAVGYRPSAAGDDPGAGRKPQAESRRPSDIQDLIFFSDARPLLIRLHIAIDGKPYRQVWSDYLNTIFDDADRDTDGVLDNDEAARVPAFVAGGFGFGGRMNFGETLRKQAGDADGRITREAFLAAFEKSDAAPLVARQGQNRTRSAAALFTLLDSDHDGKLSADELLVAESSLKSRDFDDDDIVTEAELAPGQSPYGTGPIAFAGGMQPRLPRSSLIFAVEPGTRPVDIAQALVDQYKKTSGVRLSAATPLPREEFRLPPDLLNSLDKNGDRMLGVDELASFAQRRPDVEQRLALGRDTGESEDADDSTEAAGSDGQLDIRIRRRNLGFNLEVAGTVLEFRANNTNPRISGRVFNQNQFQGFDPDNNGYIDEDEAKNNPFIMSAFKAMDRDGDGKVFRKEFETYLDRQNEASGTRLTLEVADRGQELFEMFDADRDGRLTLRELRAAADVLESADTNHDGMLGGTEIPRSMQIALSRGTGLANAANVVVVRGGTRQQPVRTSTAGPLWFRKMDRNHDGDLSPREFLGPRDDFERLDTNGDGLIDAREAEAASQSAAR